MIQSFTCSADCGLDRNQSGRERDCMSHLPGGKIHSYCLRVGFGVRPGSWWEQHHDRSRLEHELSCDFSEES